MCDTIVVVNPDGVLFAKNSDRDADEAQIVEWHPAADHPTGASLTCTYLEIPQVSHTHAVMISRPYWMWGAEIGTNEFGVTIGNEAVFTSEPYAETGLTGMDLLRLALERSTSAQEAHDIIISLLGQYGQGGGCGHEDRSFTYHNSFIIADPNGAIVLETAGRYWDSERVESGVRSISNGLTIAPFADRHSDRLRNHFSRCSIRTVLTTALSSGAATAADMTKVLRSHGGSTWPKYDLLTGSLSAPCMHAPGLAAGSVTTASWVAELRPASTQHWVTATSSPCLSIYKPVSVGNPLDLGPAPTDIPDDSLWWQAEALHRRVMANPMRLSSFLTDRDSIEAVWFTSPPSSEEAFAEHRRLVTRWTAEVSEHEDGRDVRPWYVRRFWQKHASVLAQESNPQAP